jgi:hypothetical protein
LANFYKNGHKGFFDIGQIDHLPFEERGIIWMEMRTTKNIWLFKREVIGSTSAVIFGFHEAIQSVWMQMGLR